MKKLIFLILLQIFATFVGAQDSLRKDTEAKVPAITYWAYVDAYYAYSFNQPSSRVIGEMVNGTSNIFSHNRHNEFNVNNAILGIKYSKNKIKAAFSLQAGSYVNANYFNEPDALKYIYEATAGYQLGKKAWVEAGIFTSHIGFEGAISYDCPTLTRSMMADNSPYYESGIKYTYEPNSKLLLSGLVLNGWQNITEHNKNKALGTQLQYKPSESVLVNWSTFYGKEVAAFINVNGVLNTDSLSTARFYNNFYFIGNLSNKCSLITAFDIGIQRKLIGSGNYLWFTPNVIIKYKLSEQASIGLRTEYYYDKNGVIIYSGTINGFQTFSTSLNFDYILSDGLLWRIEGKWFSSKDKVYNREDETSSQNTLVTTSLAFKF